MPTQCTATQLQFHPFGRREVVARFDAGYLSSDGGALLLREADRRPRTGRLRDVIRPEIGRNATLGEQNPGIVFAFSRPGGAVNVPPGPEGR